MNKSKSARKDLITELIMTRKIATQEELTRLVREAGFDATQATISRDIKELGIVKQTLQDGSTGYAITDKFITTAPDRLLSVLSNSLTGISVAMNILVIKTLPGMAQAAASALDSLNHPEIVGTIAGDDTIFAATRSEAAATDLSKKIKEITGFADKT
ncbi:MAG: arginine repressor [Clostridiales bacterium]|nr:arginine repressor [Clostridiales bacterium]